LTLFAGWTLLVWSGRIRNVLADDTVSSSSRAVTLIMAGLFVLAGLAVAMVAVRPTPQRTQRRIVGVAAAYTLVVWLIRGADIAFGGDHEAAFIAVHVVLAVGSIGLAGWAWRAATRVDDCEPSDVPASVS
jgi:uncharacterized membrane protein YeiH